jgi:hypothetical protein
VRRDVLEAMAEDVARGALSSRREYGSGYAITGGMKERTRWDLRQQMLSDKRHDRKANAILKHWRAAARAAAEAPVERGPTPISDGWRRSL